MLQNQGTTKDRVYFVSSKRSQPSRIQTWNAHLNSACEILKKSLQSGLSTFNQPKFGKNDTSTAFIRQTIRSDNSHTGLVKLKSKPIQMHIDIIDQMNRHNAHELPPTATIGNSHTGLACIFNDQDLQQFLHRKSNQYEAELW